MGWIQEPSSSWSLCPTQAEPPLEEELLKLMEGFKLGWGRGRGKGTRRILPSVGRICANHTQTRNIVRRLIVNYLRQGVGISFNMSLSGLFPFWFK